MSSFNSGYGRYTGMHMEYQLHPRHYWSLYKIATSSNPSPEARKRLKWFDHYRKSGNVALTCRYFDISRKTFHKWQKRYNPRDLTTLEEKSRKPHKTRDWEVSRREEFRVIALRKKYIRYGKEKIAVLYQRQHQEKISSWKVQRIIEKHHLYYQPAKTEKLRQKRKRNQHKKRITELKTEKRQGFLVALDTMARYWLNHKRYIFTAVDVYSKIAFARMYTTKSSKNATDFLQRLNYLLENKIENATKDNGTEFEGLFRKALDDLGIEHYYSRPKMPTDNPFDERFNRTLKDEFIELGNMTYDCATFNKKLTEWLIEYNFNRPHQSLGYETPVEFHYKHHKVLPMYPSSTAP